MVEASRFSPVDPNRLHLIRPPVASYQVMLDCLIDTECSYKRRNLLGAQGVHRPCDYHEDCDKELLAGPHHCKGTSIAEDLYLIQMLTLTVYMRFLGRNQSEE